MTLGAGAATAYQHDAQELPNGEITVFDNGGVPKVHPQSRGVILALNPSTKTDTLVGEYEHPTPLAAGSQGSVQALEDGNMFIGWGAEPYFSEYTASRNARVRRAHAQRRRVLPRLPLPVDRLPDRRTLDRGGCW